MTDLAAALRAAGLPDSKVEVLAASLDESKFVDDAGRIDQAKVNAFVGGIPGASTGSKGDAGRREAERRFGKPATAAPDRDTQGGAAGFPKARDVSGSSGLAEARRRFGNPTPAA